MTGDMPIRKPSGMATSAAIRKPLPTRSNEWPSWIAMPLSFGPLS